MSARDDILTQLRGALTQPTLRFPPPNPQPLTAEERLTVTAAEGDLPMLAERFARELETLHGEALIVETPVAARMALINMLLGWMEEHKAKRTGAFFESGQEECVLSWDVDVLPITGIGDTLRDIGLTVVTPDDMHNEKTRSATRYIQYGLTGVEAAFASTGSMLMTSSAPGVNRVASLLPIRHVALIPFSRVYENVEAWLREKRTRGILVKTLKENANLTMISGPSKSADIEGNLTLGVHGPKFVNAILFNDILDD
ncbi:MAG: LUD domain-containing protein [Caldilineaceae bacterium]|nr:LUD domain-containing protein [Caldilineaceae bacterium]MCB0140635.1 LUD domain-containing protein [Caldilineaceae bacterium]